MRNKLSNIAKIQSGVYAKPDINAEVYYIQGRHFNEYREFDFNTKPEIAAQENFDKHYLQIGDILVASKSNSFFAITYKGIVKPAVASSSFLVIRIEDKANILPEFIAWQINHPTNQKMMILKAQGSKIASLSKSDLDDLELEILPLSKQRSIVKLDALLNRKKQISQKIIFLTESLINKQLYKLIQNHE